MSLSGYSLAPCRLFSYYYCISYPFSVLVFVHCVPMTLYFVSWIMRLVLFPPPADFPETDLQLVAYYSILCNCVLLVLVVDCVLYFSENKLSGKLKPNLFHSYIPVAFIYDPVLKFLKNIKKCGLQMIQRKKILRKKFFRIRGFPKIEKF